MKKDEGYIKFHCVWNKQGSVVSRKELQALNRWRNILYGMGLIGVYDNGIGFGNISLRTRMLGKFIITGSATGQHRKLTGQHYTLVTEYDIPHSSVTCAGPVRASSESMTHAAIYEMSPDTNGVIHIHQLEYWQKLLDRVPTSRREVEYGTVAMAEEIKRLFREMDLEAKKILVMGGHREGIITFGKDLDEAGSYLLAYINQIVG